MGNTTQTHVYLWWSPDGVTMYPVTETNPFPVTVVSGGGSNASVGPTGVAAPGSATEVGILDGSGHLVGVSSTNPVPVSGTFFQTTQPVSVASLPLPATAAKDSSLTTINTTLGSPLQTGGAVAVSNFPATQPISGAVSFTAPQHVVVDSSSSVVVTGPLTDTQLRATSVPVSGTFFQGTQPVSIATMPTTPVTGTFFQATQPVSGAVSFTAPQHVIIDSSAGISVSNFPATQPVSGTFFQSTQPVSAVSLPLPTGAATDASLNTISTALIAGNSVIGDLGIANALNSAVELLQAIDFRLRELPTILTLSLNKGLPQPNVDTVDNFQSDYFNGLT